MNYFSKSVAGAIAATLLSSPAAFSQATPPPPLVLRNVRLIDGTGARPREGVSVVIDHGYIVSIDSGAEVKVPAGAMVVDDSGKTVMPGIVNAHGHLGLVPWAGGVWGTENSASAYTRDNVVRELKQYEAFGVTSVLSLGGNRDLVFDLIHEQRSVALGGATIFTAGRGIGVPNDGAPPIPMASDQIDRPSTPEEARADVQTMATQKVDIIKVWVDDLHGKAPKMQPAIYRAVIEEAHRHHIPVAAHVYALADAKALVADGVDVLAHSVRDQPVDQELIDTMKAHGTWYIPTFTVDESAFIYALHPGWMETTFFKTAAGPGLDAMLASAAYSAKIKAAPSTPQHKQDFAMGQQNLKRLFDAGVKVGFGTDSGAFPWRIPGFAEHRELELMVAAGLTPMQAIVCATRNNAELLHVKDRGTLAVGQRADLLVLNGNPLDDITNTRELFSIVHDGRVIAPAATTTEARAE